MFRDPPQRTEKLRRTSLSGVWVTTRSFPGKFSDLQGGPGSNGVPMEDDDFEYTRSASASTDRRGAKDCLRTEGFTDVGDSPQPQDRQGPWPHHPLSLPLRADQVIACPEKADAWYDGDVLTMY